ncbi:MAG: AAA family ATPase [Kiritimatiellia bacterium]|nr:AAA family ATPase [Kiritimatiellia bacterium]
MTTEFETLLSRAIVGDTKERKAFADYCRSNERYILALEWYRRLADAGDAEAQYHAALLYHDGKGCPLANTGKAIELLTRSAQSGYQPAARKLAEIGGRVIVAWFVVSNAYDTGYPAAADQEAQDPSYDYDRGHYANIALTIHEPDAEDDPYARLKGLIGLSDLKTQLETIKAGIQFQARRADAGLATTTSSNHFVFVGNPGTGKTEVARVLGRILKESKLLSRGHVVEVDRSDLIAGWIGHTALKTEAVLERAIGGVLFIDEAYSLAQGSGYDFGDEALTTILKFIEDRRTDLIVVMAGIPTQMDALLASNPGLSSRFRHKITFPDFSPDELCQIFDKFCRDNDFILHGDTWPALRTLFREAHKYITPDLGNARFARNAFEAAIENMARRTQARRDHRRCSRRTKQR